MKLHQKHPKGDANNFRHLQEHFNLPNNFDDQHYLLQINQARALQTAVEWFRSRQPACMGTLYWQLNDCWPVTSWAAVDGYQRRKPLWYATRRFYAERMLTIQPEEGGALIGGDGHRSALLRASAAASHSASVGTRASLR